MQNNQLSINVAMYMFYLGKIMIFLFNFIYYIFITSQFFIIKYCTIIYLLCKVKFSKFQRQELAELQAELQRRVQTLSERREAVEKLDKKLVDLVDEQLELGVPSSSEQLHNLKIILASRTEQQIQELEQRKQAYVVLILNTVAFNVIIFRLTLNLKKINTAQTPTSCPVTNISSAEGGTLSSDTYHTATSGCSTHLKMDAVEQFMSDSGVELRANNVHDESDISSTESQDCKVISVVIYRLCSIQFISSVWQVIHSLLAQLRKSRL